ncbi:MAG: GNAT family N-acetyltransferase [Candidatus Heimdallarchaeota archaeon]|nr:GNAT family N-acetyltransferase [Candidatus Heimdallarchaeota archaeon]
MNPREEITIRKLKESDIASIASLDELISGISRPEMWKSDIQHYLKNNSIGLVAEIQEQVIGFMIGTIHPWLFGIENGGWIEILGVDPKHTAKGVGKKLGEKLLEAFKSRGIKVVHTTVEWTSSDLLEFFHTLGMTKSDYITLMKEL